MERLSSQMTYLWIKMPTSVTWPILPGLGEENHLVNFSATCIMFYPSHHVHGSERSADLAVVRYGEMEGGEIFATKAAKCFCPLHAICALSKASDWQFYKLASPNSFLHVILCAGNIYSLVICFNLSCGKSFPLSLGWGGHLPCVLQQATVCLSDTIHHIIYSSASSASCTCLRCISYELLTN